MGPPRVRSAHETVLTKETNLAAHLEIAGRRYNYLVLRERMPPEVEGDVDDMRSPRDDSTDRM